MVGRVVDLVLSHDQSRGCPLRATPAHAWKFQKTVGIIFTLINLLLSEHVNNSLKFAVMLK